ncbi:MAG: hypothetical protein HOP12_14305 [Candidatus Eisenbacteria bacterium]|uniref:Uncharacterized protein n=1 Tax=Eiseniibacteriota bacterium TaxID=2212470 RepID=A0A849SIW1_UNCEI|nr:hypothetical protein [Candidatus Eisenbacteria bacterium]
MRLARPLVLHPRFVGSALLACLGAFVLSTSARAGFEPVSNSQCIGAHRLGPDSSVATGSRALGPSRGLAQTFRTDDTLVRAVTVWLPGPSRVLRAPLRVYLTLADHAGRPRLDQIIAEGPPVSRGAGDGIRPSRFEFTFSPPLALPARGTYAVVVIADECGLVSLLTRDELRAARQPLWEVARRGCAGSISEARGELSDHQLVMQVEVCDRGTMVSGRTWGEMKARYR